MRNVGTLGLPAIDRQRKRKGCLGCLAQMIGILIIGLVVGGVLDVAIERVFHPWAFYFGGHSHLLPFWQGIGRMHSSDGDYVVTVSLYPSRGTPMFNLPTFKGTGYLCTPRGQRFPLFVRGSLSEKTGTDTNGKEMSLRFFRHPWLAGITSGYSEPPRLYFRGKWQNPDLVMDDGGSLAAAFLPDGSVNDRPLKYYHADAKNRIPVVFHEITGLRAWWIDCRSN